MSNVTKGLICLRPAIALETFFAMVLICSDHVRFSSTMTPTDLLLFTLEIDLLLILSWGFLWMFLSLYFDAINMYSVFAAFRLSLLAASPWRSRALYLDWVLSRVYCSQGKWCSYHQHTFLVSWFLDSWVSRLCKWGIAEVQVWYPVELHTTGILY